MKHLFALLALAFASQLMAQTIKLELPAHAGDYALFTLKQGLKSDTVFNGKLDKKGAATIQLPLKNAGYTGIGSLALQDAGGFDMIVNGKSYTFHCSEAGLQPDKVSFIGSDENTAFLEWKKARYTHDQRNYLLTQLAGLYKPEDTFFGALSQERGKVDEEQIDIAAPQPDWYAPRYAELFRFMATRLTTQADFKNAETATAIRAYATDTLDIEALYTSGLWYNIINGVLGIYQPDAPFERSFAVDATLMLLRIKSQPIYEAFASDLMMICDQFGWDRAQSRLVNFLLNHQRIKNPKDARLKALYSIAATSAGNPAPLINGLSETPIGTLSLLLFYESGCPSCQDVIRELKTNYPFFQERNVRIITISADTDKEVFQTYADTFPWIDKISDFKGFVFGSNFDTYGILGTPTLFLLDKDGKIIDRYSHVQDIIEELKKKQ